MQPSNIKTVLRRIWNQNFTELVSTKLVIKNHSYIHILSSDGQMTTRLYQRIAVSLLTELIFGKSIFVYETSNLLHVCNKAFLSNLSIHYMIQINWWPHNVSTLWFYIAFVALMVSFWTIYFTQQLFSNADIIEEDGSSHEKNTKPLIKQHKCPNVFKVKFDF